MRLAPGGDEGGPGAVTNQAGGEEVKSKFKIKIRIRIRIEVGSRPTTGLEVEAGGRGEGKSGSR